MLQVNLNTSAHGGYDVRNGESHLGPYSLQPLIYAESSFDINLQLDLYDSQNIFILCGVSSAVLDSTRPMTRSFPLLDKCRIYWLLLSSNLSVLPSASTRIKTAFFRHVQNTS